MKKNSTMECNKGFWTLFKWKEDFHELPEVCPRCFQFTNAKLSAVFRLAPLALVSTSSWCTRVVCGNSRCSWLCKKWKQSAAIRRHACWRIRQWYVGHDAPNQDRHHGICPFMVHHSCQEFMPHFFGFELFSPQKGRGTPGGCTGWF